MGKWTGLFTNASPFDIPAGASVIQKNLTNDTLGQLTTRGGMCGIAALDTIETRDIHSFSSNGIAYLISVHTDGKLKAYASPVLKSLPAAPTEPAITSTGDNTATSYTMKYASGREAS